MPQTAVSPGSKNVLPIHSGALFAAVQQRRSTLRRLVGNLPTGQAQAESRIRGDDGVQSSTDYPIVQNKSLSTRAGQEIVFDFVQPAGGYPVMGDEIVKGTGSKITLDQAGLRINQARKEISAGGAMTQQRTVPHLRNLAMAQATGFLNDFIDQRYLVHLAGARGYHNNSEWRIPLADHAKFGEMMVNPVKAPTKNRHFMSTGSGIEPIAVSGGEISLATTDTMGIDVLDALSTWLDSTPLPPAPVKFDGDELANDVPLRVLLVSAEQYTAIKKSGNFRQLQAQALTRAQTAKQNPLFLGEAVVWNGVLAVKMPKPIRFYAGSTLNYCADLYSTTETGVLVPASFGTKYAVDRAILLGGQALAHALGGHRKAGTPIFFGDTEDDYDNLYAAMCGTIDGVAKVRFNIDFGNGLVPTDLGAVAVDTVVEIAGV